MRTLCGLIIFALLLAIPVAILADVFDLLTGNPKTGIQDAGDVLVWDDGDFLYVKYELDFAPWKFDSIHLEVSDVGPEQIPQKNGNPIPGQFAYINGPEFKIPLIGTHPVTGEPYTWGKDEVLYIAAHGTICRDLVTPNLPGESEEVTISVSIGVPPNHYIVKISDGVLEGTYIAYCIDPLEQIAVYEDPDLSVTYDVTVSTNDAPNMDQLNYMLNQDYSGLGAGHSEIQAAIWGILWEVQSGFPGYPDPDPDSGVVSQIVLDAQTNGVGFEHRCGDYLVLKLKVDDDTQRLIIKVPLECGECATAWAGIVDYSVVPPTYDYEFDGKNWALYVKYTVGSASLPDAAPPRTSSPSSVTTTWGSIKNR